MNFHHAKTPRVENVKNLVSEPIELLGDSGYLAVAQHAGIEAVNLHGRDVQVIDTAATPRLLATVAHVSREALRGYCLSGAPTGGRRNEAFASALH